MVHFAFLGKYQWNTTEILESLFDKDGALQNKIQQIKHVVIANNPFEARTSWKPQLSKKYHSTMNRLVFKQPDVEKREFLPVAAAALFSAFSTGFKTPSPGDPLSQRSFKARAAGW